MISTDDEEVIMKQEYEITECKKEDEYVIETEIADNVVIGIIYKMENGEKVEVCRGHGHIIHEGAEGIAQACAYAYKQALISIDSGIYMKQRKRVERR